MSFVIRNMSYMNSLVIVEHRFCVKIITHFFNNYRPDIHLHNHLNGILLKDLESIGPISEDQYKTLKKWIFTYDRCDFLYEKGYSPNPLEEIVGIYLLFFKFVMNIENNRFCIKEELKDREKLMIALLPEYSENYQQNSFDWAWEEIKRSSDEYEIGKILEMKFLDPIFNQTKILAPIPRKNILKRIKDCDDEMEDVMGTIQKMDL